ncbi:MAG: hypothetical protein NWF00_08580 [Candidatus Bathyarchaeota archaeon]|nr:hypothetical protein [Candidatus Bathyarchaeota archaeon]
MRLKTKYLVMGGFALIGLTIGLAKVPRNRKEAVFSLLLYLRDIVVTKDILTV